MCPDYLSELVVVRKPVRTTRFSEATSFEYSTTRSKTKFYGSRVFARYAPEEWNRLPKDLRGVEKLECFKKRLKTHLFRQHFDFGTY